MKRQGNGRGFGVLKIEEEEGGAKGYQGLQGRGEMRGKRNRKGEGVDSGRNYSLPAK